ncbi:MAG: ribosome biogenesis GTP-binding protein YihA/YsxC [Betaproteobacteria bacterium]
MRDRPAPVEADPLLESARYVTSVAEGEQLQRAALAMLPEVAVVGRSNAGKSSTINVLANRRQLAHASKTPGRTQMLNFFELSQAGAGRERQPVAYLVDLPGYGFAKVDHATRARWDQLVGGYLHTRRMLSGVLLVMDARHPFKDADEELLAWLTGREDADRLRLHLLLNKSDQLTQAERAAALALAESRAEALPMPTSVQLFSALKRTGLAELRLALRSMLPAR